VKQEAGNMNFVSGIWFLGRRLTPHQGSQFDDTQTGSDDPHPFVDLLANFPSKFYEFL
jgi:hypothetical protein